MSKYPAPDREHHDDFCVTEAWTLVQGATGKPVKHHRTYEFTLHNGNILRTRISQPIDRTTYAPTMWSHILRDQLEVTNPVFWNCVRNKVLPNRGGSIMDANPKAIPLHILNEAVTRLALSPEEAAQLGLAVLLERLNEHWSTRAEADTQT